MPRLANFGAYIAASMLVILLGACATGEGYIRDVPAGKTAYTPKLDKALVVFIRPSIMGVMFTTSIYDVTNGEPEFTALVYTKTKIARYVAPGKRRLMVIGGGADFIAADLVPGKVYYVLVKARYGAPFGLAPITTAEVNQPRFAGWYEATRWIENLNTAQTWAHDNKADAVQKHTPYLPRWLSKAERPVLKPEDGQVSLYRASTAKKSKAVVRRVCLERVFETGPGP